MKREEGMGGGAFRAASIDPRLMAGIDQIDAGFAIFDDQLRLLVCNARYPQIRGYPAELCRPGTALAELFRFNALRGDYGAGDVNCQVSERIAQIERCLPMEIDQVLGDGRVLLARYRPLPGGGVATSYEDVTELRSAAQALRDDRERYGLVTEAVSEGIYDWNIASNSLAVSDRLKRIFGFEQDELISADWAGRVHPDDRAIYADAMRLHFKGETPVLAVAYRIRIKTGGYRWIEDHAKAIRNKPGRAIRLVGAIADITDRKESERALAESEERYALAMSAINEGVYDFDLRSNRSSTRPVCITRWASARRTCRRRKTGSIAFIPRICRATATRWPITSAARPRDSSANCGFSIPMARCTGRDSTARPSGIRRGARCGWSAPRATSPPRRPCSRSSRKHEPASRSPSSRSPRALPCSTATIGL